MLNREKRSTFRDSFRSEIEFLTENLQIRMGFFVNLIESTNGERKVLHVRSAIFCCLPLLAQESGREAAFDVKIAVTTTF